MAPLSGGSAASRREFLGVVRPGRQGFSLLEILLSAGIIAVGLYAFLYFSNTRERALVKATADNLARAMNRCTKHASSSHRAASGQGVAQVVFRPKGGPYRSYLILVDGQQQEYREFEPGIYLVNTNGLLRDDRLFIREDGALVSGDSGRPRESPDPGYLTAASDEVDAVSLIVVRLVGGFSVP